MALTSKISPYDPQWPAMFETERDRLLPIFEAELVRIHHMGGTAVPGLSAKPEIDLLFEVWDHRNQKDRESSMRALGYIRGSDLAADHHFYRRDFAGIRTHKVHVCVTGHRQLQRMLRFRDLLRNDPTVRQQYQDRKLHLEATNREGIAEYLAKKAPFICMLMGSRPQ